MIQDFVLKNLERTTQKLLNRNIDTISGELVGNSVQHISDDAFTLYYGKFRSDAPKIRALVEQLEQRVTKHEEYQFARSDIYRGYCLERQRLLPGSVGSAVNQLAIKNKGDYCALVRAASAFMLHVCQDEHQLWKHFFTSKSPHLNEMLERLCQTLYRERVEIDRTGDSKKPARKKNKYHPDEPRIPSKSRNSVENFWSGMHGQCWGACPREIWQSSADAFFNFEWLELTKTQDGYRISTIL